MCLKAEKIQIRHCAFKNQTQSKITNYFLSIVPLYIIIIVYFFFNNNNSQAIIKNDNENVKNSSSRVDLKKKKIAFPLWISVCRDSTV